jgi:hypothetical protein
LIMDLQYRYEALRVLEAQLLTTCEENSTADF